MLMTMPTAIRMVVVSKATCKMVGQTTSLFSMYMHANARQLRCTYEHSVTFAVEKSLPQTRTMEKSA